LSVTQEAFETVRASQFSNTFTNGVLHQSGIMNGKRRPTDSEQESGVGILKAEVFNSFARSEKNVYFRG
jgi:hypothetical protein